MNRIFKFFQKNNGDEAREEEISKMVTGLQKLSQLVARDVMIPRVDMLAIDQTMTPKDLFNFVATSTHSKFPVHKDTVDNIVGLIYVKDLLKAAINIDSFDIESIMRQPFFVPETMYLDMLLHEMKRKRIHIAIVVDEYGGVSGIVCLEDILEEIVGEILDEFDNESEEFLKISNDVFLVEARLPLSKFNELTSLSLPDEDYDTIGGYVYNLFGKIPVSYEKVSDGTIDYVVQVMEGNKIKSIKVVLKK